MKKFFALVLASILVLPVFNQAASAETDFSTATEINMNTSTDSSKPYTTTLDNCNSETDQKVYKITLPANTEESVTLVTPKQFDVRVFGSSNLTEPIASKDQFGSEIAGNRQFKFFTDTNTTYYFVLTPSNDGAVSYPYYLRLTVGEPLYLYSGGTYSTSLSTMMVNATSKVSATYSYIDLEKVTSIPDDAILTGIWVNGTETGSASGRVRNVKPLNSSSWINCNEFMFESKNLDYVPKVQQIHVKQRYSFKHSISSFISGSSYGLAPTIHFDYKYEMK